MRAAANGRARPPGRRGGGVWLVAVLLLAGTSALAEEAAKKPKPTLKELLTDPEDGALDLTRWLSGRTGFLPVVAPITEPAVGYGAAGGLVHFGGAGRGSGPDAPKGPTGQAIPRDISAVGGGVTENGTWAAAVGHIGHWGGDRWRYKGAVAKISPVLDTYSASGQAFGFNLDGWTVYQEIAIRLGRSDLFGGVKLLYLDSTVEFESAELPPGVESPSFGMTDVGLGAFLEYDTRDNNLTPGNGVNFKASAMLLGSWLGGDNDFQRYGGLARLYWTAQPRLVMAARVQAQLSGGDPPFYALPFVVLRGIPVMRYQGVNVVSVDGETRWNAWKRWWLVAFAGAGWTDAGDSRLREPESVVAGGFGFRYLLARGLGLHGGVDVAKGPEQWAFYVVVGSSF
ncbi:hypothetical protein FBQ97_01490 [Acidobacteria bacterium ACD]|nr:MAG: hypothetical protein EDX89_09750 [Acidobacteriota bacterium]MCE7958072.1 hypothetical protein [Acidobacteria bacterium ACB2]MDL1948475.1 hypothetical protein [Acidobacteria bacterium ACD]